MTMGNLAVLLKCMGKLMEAKNLYDVVLPIKEKHFGEGDINTANTLGNLGDVLQELKKYDEAK